MTTAIVPTHMVPLSDDIVILLHIHCDEDIQSYELKGAIIADDFEYGILVAIADDQIDAISTTMCPNMIDFTVANKNTHTMNIIDCNEDVGGESIIGDWVNASYTIKNIDQKWRFCHQFSNYSMVTGGKVSGFKVCLNIDPSIIFNDPPDFIDLVGYNDTEDIGEND